MSNFEGAPEPVMLSKEHEEWVYLEDSNILSRWSLQVVEQMTANESLHMLGAVTTARTDLLMDMEPYNSFTADVLDCAGIQLVGERGYSFSTLEDQSGFTSVHVLSESHISTHTWPEKGTVELDVYLCDFLRDNKVKGATIFGDIVHYFEPHDIVARAIARPKLSLNDTSVD